MNFTTRQKVLIGLIVIFLAIIIWEIRAIYLIKFENKQVVIPYTHKTLSQQNYIENTAEKLTQQHQSAMAKLSPTNKPILQNNQQQTLAANTIQNKPVTQNTATNVINSNNIANSNNPLLIREKQLQQAEKDKSLQNQSTIVAPSVNNNGAQLTDADKQYIQSVVNNRLAQINQHLAQNDVAINSVNSTAEKALATATALQNNTNERLTKDEQAIVAANNNANKALTDTNNTLAAINDRLTKDEAAITAANNTASQTLATVSKKTTIAASTASNPVTPVVPTVPITTTTTDTLFIPKDTVNSAATKSQGVSTPANHPVVNQSVNKPQVTAIINVAPLKTPPKIHHHLTQLPGVYQRIMHENPTGYTIQLIADSGLGSLYEYMRAYCLGYYSIPLHTKHFGKNWYVLIYGQFDTVYQANAALQQFPYSALEWRPFVRKMSDVQRMITDSRGEDALVRQS